MITNEDIDKLDKEKILNFVSNMYGYKKIKVPSSFFGKLNHFFKYNGPTKDIYFNEKTKKWCNEQTFSNYFLNIEFAISLIEIIRDSQKICCLKIESDYNYRWSISLTFEGNKNHEPAFVVHDEDLILAIFKTSILFLNETIKIDETLLKPKEEK